MNILLTNTTVFSIKATTNSQEIILLPNQSVNTDCDQKSLIKLSYINTDRFDAKSIANNLMLNVSCTYSIETISENQNIHISNKIFELDSSTLLLATVYKGNIIKNLIMDCQSYTKYRPNETTGGIFVSWRRKEELPTGA